MQLFLISKLNERLLLKERIIFANFIKNQNMTSKVVYTGDLRTAATHLIPEA
jgi:hypothetical protein